MEDRLAIADIIHMHGHLTDAGALDRYDEVFTRDVVYDVSDFEMGELRGIDEIAYAGRMVGFANPVGHHVTNVVVGQKVRDGRVQVVSKGIGIMSDGTAGSVVYEDTVTRQDGGWRIARRKVLVRRTPLGGILDGSLRRGVLD